MLNNIEIKDIPSELQEDLLATHSKLLDILMMQAEIRGIRLATSWYGRGLTDEDVESQVKAILANKYQGDTLDKYLGVLFSNE